MKLSKNFSHQEFTKSQTALRQGIDNTPNDEHMEAAKKLFENVVQKVRDNFDPTIINSGYRGPKLNEAVGGSSRSQHSESQQAQAGDLLYKYIHLSITIHIICLPNPLVCLLPGTKSTSTFRN